MTSGGPLRLVVPERNVRSTVADSMLADLIALTPRKRDPYLVQLTERDWQQLAGAAQRAGGSPWALWLDDPTGFCAWVLGETLWSAQKRVLRSYVSQPITAVPAGQGLGKTMLAARALVHWIACHPPGAATAVTTAVNMRQVRRQLWPDVGKVVARAGLPGIVDTAQWRIPTNEGRELVAAYGFTAPVGNESAVQGIHAPRLLIIVEEAGGMEPTVGRAFRGLAGTEGARLIAIGNPPTDVEGSWFEDLSSSPSVSRIDLPVTIGPEFTGEVTPRCRTCPPGLEPHAIAAHLHGRTWLDGVIVDYGGEEARWVQAKAYARFPKGGPDRVMSDDDLQASLDPEPRRPHRPGGWVRLGVDVAAGGGDALAVSMAVDERVKLLHVERGPALNNPVDVAGIIRREGILPAQRLRAQLGTGSPLRVKIDAIGVGWGVAGILMRWADEGHLGDTEVIPVVVSESVHPDRQKGDTSTLRPRTKRDELWLAGRALSQTVTGDDSRAWSLDVPRAVLAQLGAPKMTTSSTGFTVVESKESMRKRGVRSPDEAESVLLAFYEPEPLVPRKKGRLILAGGR